MACFTAAQAFRSKSGAAWGIPALESFASNSRRAAASQSILAQRALSSADGSPQPINMAATEMMTIKLRMKILCNYGYKLLSDVPL
jgi:hypothetical protein